LQPGCSSVAMIPGPEEPVGRGPSERAPRTVAVSGKLRQEIADAGLGQDEFGLTGVLLDLLA